MINTTLFRLFRGILTRFNARLTILADNSVKIGKMTDFRFNSQKEVGCITKINQILDPHDNKNQESGSSWLPLGLTLLVEVILETPVYLEKEVNIPSLADVIMFDGKVVLARGIVVDILD